MLDEQASTGAQRLVAEPAGERGHLLTQRHGVGGGGEEVAATDVDVVGEADGHRLRGYGHVERLLTEIDPRNRGPQPRRVHDDLVADPHRTRCELSRVPAVLHVFG